MAYKFIYIAWWTRLIHIQLYLSRVVVAGDFEHDCSMTVFKLQGIYAICHLCFSNYDNIPKSNPNPDPNSAKGVVPSPRWILHQRMTAEAGHYWKVKS